MAGENASQLKPSRAHAPQGMVMGPDGKPCKICTAFRNWKPGTTNYTEADSDRDAWAPQKGANASPSGQKQKSKPTGFSVVDFVALSAAAPAANVSNDTTATTHDTMSYRGDEPPPGCPPDVEQLGRATWTFLHTTAAYYPEKPTPTQRANMLMLLRSLPVLYPCTWCAKSLGKNMEKSPPDVSGRVALSRWLCERHNEVNERLGKEKFDCAKVDERWKDGPPDGSCD